MRSTITHYARLTITPVAGSLGAEVHGVDLRQPLDTETYVEIRKALLKNLVIFCGDQGITPGQQVALRRNFGDLAIHPLMPSLKDHPEIIVLEAKNGEVENLRLANAWHEDLS